MEKPFPDKIKNLLFDLGGVIMDIRRQNCVEALSQLGVQGVGELIGDYCQAGEFLRLEEGKMSANEFRDYIRSRCPNPLSDSQINDAFEAFLIGIPLNRLQALEQLRRRYKVYMLSNTNEIMFYGKISREFEKDGHNMAHYFDGICTSFETGVAKPDPLIFHAVEKQFGILPDETLFFDDSITNIEAARKLGFYGWHVPEGTEFTDAFK